jgi:hypothetical protein
MLSTLSQFSFSQVNQSFDKLLAGRISCLIAKDTSTKPAIRCRSSVEERNAPLFVLDGQPVEAKEVSSLNSESIKSFSFLKSPEATVIYGCRNVKGVIIITLKKLKECRLLILDETDSLPISGATVSIKANRQSKTYLSNADGLFTIPAMSKGVENAYEITSIGYLPSTKSISFDSADQRKIIYLKRAFKKMDDVVITTASYGRVIRCGGCGIRVVRTHQHNLIQSPKAIFSFNVFPNPLLRSNTLTILTHQSIKGNYQILSISGQILQTVRINANAETPVKANTNFLSAGTYFIRLTDEDSGKQLTEKFIVQ